MTTTIATAVQQPKPTLAQYIARLQPEIQRALPRHLSGDRMARLALTEIRKSQLAKEKGISKQSLQDCNPESFAGALLTAAAIGVEIGTPEAYLVPYRGECTLIVGYQGYTKLFWQSGQGASLQAHPVYEKDEFDYSYGLDPHLHHKPARGERGAVIFYYAAVALKDGGKHFEVLTPEEVKALRGNKEGGNGNIADPQRWMERKTAIRQVLKPMPKSSQMTLAVEADERDGGELYMERLAENAPAAITAAPTAEQAPPGVDARTGEVTNPEGWDPSDGPDQAYYDQINAENSK